MKCWVKTRWIAFATWHRELLAKGNETGYNRVNYKPFFVFPLYFKYLKGIFVRDKFGQQKYIYCMNLRQYLAIMGMATALCWVSWIFVLFNIDPFLDTGLGFFFFYLTFFFALIGSLSIIVFILYIKYLKFKSQRKGKWAFGRSFWLLLLQYLF